MDPETLMGPLIDDTARQTMMQAIEAVKNQGGTVVRRYAPDRGGT